MDVGQWRVQIDLACAFGDSGVDVLESYRIGLENDSELSSDEKLDLQNLIDEKLIDLLPRNLLVNNGLPINERKLPTKYNGSTVSVALEDGIKIFNPDGIPYARWLRDVYLPNFHPMPYGEVQYPIMVCLMLLNCNAVLENPDGESINYLPMPFCLGLRGSGKSEFVKQVFKHYPKNRRIWTKPNFTGSSIRDIIDEHSKAGQPTITCLDNFNPAVSIPALGRHYDLILSNNKEDAIAAVSNRGHEEQQSEYVTYSYKWLTSVFDLETHKSEEAKEITRRTITLCFQAATPNEPVRAYNWSKMEDIYYDIWSDEASLAKGYFSHLYELVRISPKLIPFPDPAHWEISQMPIALGTHLGVFESTWDGINHFAEYYKVLDGMKRSSVKDLFSQLIDQYVVSYYPAMCKANKDMGYDASVIQLEDLKRYLQRHNIAISQSDIRSNIPKALSEYGYVLNTNDGISFIR